MQTMVSVTLTYDEEIKQWGAWIEGVGAFAQGDTPQKALDDLKEALALYIEEAGRERFEEEISPPMQMISIPLETLVPAA